MARYRSRREAQAAEKVARGALKDELLRTAAQGPELDKLLEVCDAFGASGADALMPPADQDRRNAAAQMRAWLERQAATPPQTTEE